MKTVFISGNFNIIHPGHLRLLIQGKELGGRLVVGVRSDRLAGNSAHVPEILRLEGIRSLSLVDDAFLFDGSIKEVILNLKPDIVVKGLEHKSSRNEELEVLNSYGGRLVFSSGESQFSSLDLIRKDLGGKEIRGFKFPNQFARQNKFDKSRLINIVNDFSKLKVIVIGDLIVDEYIFCDALGMSQEDPTIVVTPVSEKRYIGGAGIVALHGKKLGAKIYYIGLAGGDNAETFVKSEFKNQDVGLTLIKEDGRPTTIKKRYRAKDKTLLRVSILHQASVSEEKQNELFDAFLKNSEGCRLLIFSDFSYGALPEKLVSRLINYAKLKNMMIAADSQSSSQNGDISRFKGVDLITPTEYEARTSLRNTDDGLVILINMILEKSQARNVILKMGSEGVLMNSVESLNEPIQKIQALNSSPVDVAGAGDSMLITASMALASGASIYEAACLGSFAAAIQIAQIGNSPIKKEDLINTIRNAEGV